HKIPFFGICLGMQLAVVEYARNVCKLEKANSFEFDPETLYPVVDLLPEQKNVTEKGGTMRLGAYPCVLEKDTFAIAAYGVKEISERHRHRYEYNNSYREILIENGMRISGESPDGRLVEIVELDNQPWYLGCQFRSEERRVGKECGYRWWGRRSIGKSSIRGAGRQAD